MEEPKKEYSFRSVNNFTDEQISEDRKFFGSDREAMEYATTLCTSEVSVEVAHVIGFCVAV